MCLPYKSKHLGVAFFPEDYGLRFPADAPLVFYSPLKCQDHRTCRIDNLNVVLPSQLIGLWWFTMCAQQHLSIMQGLQLLVINRLKPLLMQAFNLHAIVYDVAQTIEFAAFGQFFLRLADGSGNSKTETTAIVYLNIQIHLSDVFIITFG